MHWDGHRTRGLGLAIAATSAAVGLVCLWISVSLGEFFTWAAVLALGGASLAVLLTTTRWTDANLEQRPLMFAIVATGLLAANNGWWTSKHAFTGYVCGLAIARIASRRASARA